MSKFKVGDLVVRTSEDSVLGVGWTYQVVAIESFKGGEHLKLKSYEEFGYWSSENFVPISEWEREELIKAIEVFNKYDIRKSVYLGKTYYFVVTHSPSLKEEELIEHLFPSETPQQKKLRELEEQQLKIAAQMEELRNSM